MCARSFPAGDRRPVALADGHGSAKSFRSHQGAQFAVETAVSVCREFLGRMKDAEPSAVKSEAELRVGGAWSTSPRSGRQTSTSSAHQSPSPASRACGPMVLDPGFRFASPWATCRRLLRRFVYVDAFQVRIYSYLF